MENENEKVTGLVFARQLAGMSTDALAKKLQVTRSLISGWENNLKNIPEKRLDELERILNVDRKYLQKTLTLEDEFEIWVSIRKNEYKHKKNDCMDELVSNLNDRNNYDVQRNKQLLLDIEILRTLQELASTFTAILDSDKVEIKEEFLKYMIFVQTFLMGNFKETIKLEEPKKEDEEPKKQSIKDLLAQRK